METKKLQTTLLNYSIKLVNLNKNLAELQKKDVT